ncbi:Uncharacterised protein [Mycobacteroides abscessus subsp. massiliense]|uniref:hypothetical protein n=1 Tax=Mycobacteroides abscessus TaxID=36809 RepID=UPI0009A6C32A|nr:hypothetical protein [Mycobacteroides abscessus]SLC04661.1 Uncharacterised protein [Mycobacteroides abscessus subsp. massiliense]
MTAPTRTATGVVITIDALDPKAARYAVLELVAAELRREHRVIYLAQRREEALSAMRSLIDDGHLTQPEIESTRIGAGDLRVNHMWGGTAHFMSMRTGGYYRGNADAFVVAGSEHIPNEVWLRVPSGRVYVAASA